MHYRPPTKLRAWGVFLGVICGAILVGYQWRQLGRNTGYAPEQPLPFDHAQHAGQLQIPCQYCHADARRSRHASIPPMQLCMNCHQVVATEKPAIRQLRKAVEAGRPLPWVRVHDLPDHVYFTHRVHVAKEIACQECHGAVETMAVVRQAKGLEMGFCIECHRAKQASTECSACHQ